LYKDATQSRIHGTWSVTKLQASRRIPYERKGERLEVEDISATEEAIDPDTERMRGELGVEARGEARNIGGWGVGRWDRNRTCNLRFRILFA
jgi:hypothetical protein